MCSSVTMGAPVVIITCGPWHKDGIRSSLRVVPLIPFVPVRFCPSDHVTSRRFLRLTRRPQFILFHPCCHTFDPFPFTAKLPFSPHPNPYGRRLADRPNLVGLEKPVVPRGTRGTRPLTSRASVWTMSLLESTSTI